MQEWLQDGRRQWTSPLETMPVEQLPQRFIKPSTAEAKVRSIRLQHAGDLQFQELDFSAALSDYQDALMTAQDRAEPYFRLALAKAAISNFDDAVLNLKLGLQLDNDWPQTAPPLSDLFGEHNLLPKTQFKHRVLNWVQDDIRDPDRLFLMGVVLHLDSDVERAFEIFEAAARLGGMKQHLHAFLLPADQNAQAVLVNDGQGPVEPAPPPAPGIDDEAPVVPAVPTPPVGPALPPVENIIPPPLPE
jgi:tetratricopeptide (TPR) repeat protein